MRSILRIAFFGAAFVFWCAFWCGLCFGVRIFVVGVRWLPCTRMWRYGSRSARPFSPQVVHVSLPFGVHFILFDSLWLTVSLFIYLFIYLFDSPCNCLLAHPPSRGVQLRIGSAAPGPGDFDIVKWYHVDCFPFPRKLKSEGETCQTFVETILEDNTEESILNDDEEKAAVIALLEKKGCRKKVDGGDSPPNSKGASDVIAKIKRDADLIAQEEEDGPKSKKVKTETEISETDRAKAEIFAVLSSKKVDELKDVLRWNKQIVGGNKDTLLARIIDAKLRGRLGRCPSCLRGRVKLTEEDGGGA